MNWSTKIHHKPQIVLIFDIHVSRFNKFLSALYILNKFISSQSLNVADRAKLEKLRASARRKTSQKA